MKLDGYKIISEAITLDEGIMSIARTFIKGIKKGRPGERIKFASWLKKLRTSSNPSDRASYLRVRKYAPGLGE